MLQRLMGNVDMIGAARKAYHSREAFDVHPTTRHSEQDPFPDQIKAASFILKSKLLKPDTTRTTAQTYDGPGLISAPNMDAYATGKKKVKDNFNRKLFSLYGVLNLEEAEGRDSD